MVSVGLEMWLGDNIDRVYYGTDTRAAELLFGCLLAVWWSGRRPRAARAPRPGGSDDGRTLTAVADVLGVVALLAMFGAWDLVEQTSTRLSHGGFPVYALGTTIIIYAATRPGLVSRFLSIPFLRWAGLISYGLYLYHWPIFLLLDEERTGLSTVPAVRRAHGRHPRDRPGVVLPAGAADPAGHDDQDRPSAHRRRASPARVDRGRRRRSWSPSTRPQSQIPYADQQFERLRRAPPSTRPAPGSSVTCRATGAPPTSCYFGDSSAEDASPAISAMFRAAGTPNFI